VEELKMNVKIILTLVITAVLLLTTGVTAYRSNDAENVVNNKILKKNWNSS
jgi:hypothetical protein